MADAPDSTTSPSGQVMESITNVKVPRLALVLVKVKPPSAPEVPVAVAVRPLIVVWHSDSVRPEYFSDRSEVLLIGLGAFADLVLPQPIG